MSRQLDIETKYFGRIFPIILPESNINISHGTGRFFSSLFGEDEDSNSLSLENVARIAPQLPASSETRSVLESLDANIVPSNLFGRIFPIILPENEVSNINISHDTERYFSRIFGEDEEESNILSLETVAPIAPPLPALRKTRGFLESLDAQIVPSDVCHPDAVKFRANFKQNRNELTDRLMKLYNQHVFENKLIHINVSWSKTLRKTAGICRLYQRTKRARECLPELPEIKVKHNYCIDYKYTYKCADCGFKSQVHSKSKKNSPCSRCRGKNIEVFLNRKDKSGKITLVKLKERKRKSAQS